MDRKEDQRAAGRDGWLRRGARGLLVVLAGLMVFLAVLVGYAWLAMFGPGLTTGQRARILVHDTKFGMRAVDRAVHDGDAILPALRKESVDFTQLHRRNAPWIAEVLGSIRTEASRAVLEELRARPSPRPHLVGTVGLLRQGSMRGGVLEDLVVLEAVRTGLLTAEGRLALEALGRSGDTNVSRVLLPLLADPQPYEVHAVICEGLARLKAPEAVPALKACLARRDFHALPEAFRALIALGERDAVPLAIARIGPEIKGHTSGFLVNELWKVTGERLGWEREPWEAWWQKNGDTWRIPEVFHRPWDEQPRR